MFKLHPRNWLVNDTLWKTCHLIVGYWLNHGSYIYSSNGPTRVVTIISDGISTSDVSKLLCTPKGPAILSAGTSRTRCSSTSWNWGRWAWLWTQANFTGTLTALATTRDGSQSLIPCSHLVEQAIVNRRCRVRIAKSWKLVFATISQRVNCGNSRGFHHQVCQLRYQRPTFTSPAPKLSCRAVMPGRTWQTCKKRDSGWAASLFGLQSLDLLWATHLLMLFSKWFAQTWPTMPKHVESYQAPPDWSVALWSTPQSMTGRWSGRASNWVCHASVWLTPTSTRHTPWQQLPTCSLRMMGENCFHFFFANWFQTHQFQLSKQMLTPAISSKFKFWFLAGLEGRCGGDWKDDTSLQTLSWRWDSSGCWTALLEHMLGTRWGTGHSTWHPVQVFGWPNPKSRMEEVAPTVWPQMGCIWWPANTSTRSGTQWSTRAEFDIGINHWPRFKHLGINLSWRAHRPGLLELQVWCASNHFHYQWNFDWCGGWRSQIVFGLFWRQHCGDWCPYPLLWGGHMAPWCQSNHLYPGYLGMILSWIFVTKNILWFFPFSLNFNPHSMVQSSNQLALNKCSPAQEKSGQGLHVQLGLWLGYVCSGGLGDGG